VNELLTYAVMFDPLTVVNVQFVIMLTELNKSAKSGTRDYHSPIRMNHTKNYGCESLTFLVH